MQENPTLHPQEFLADPNPLAAHYSRFRVEDRLLLTGHSHQAWPDCSREGQLEAWEDAAEAVDEKWQRAFAKAERVRRGFGALMEDPDGLYALGVSTHEMLIRFLSALPLRERPRLITTDGEFHAIRRQLTRLQEEGIEVVRVAADPPEGVADRLRREVTDRTAAVLVSSVFFGNARLVKGLGEVLATCRLHGAELLVDTYHSLNVAPFSIREQGLEDAFSVGGGYKYCQLGEGNAFLRLPSGREWRPVITGWFGEFGSLETAAGAERVSYGKGPDAFAGSTYDPTSHYRASRVFDFLEEMELTPAFLRQISQRQMALLCEGFDDLDLPPALIDRDRQAPLREIAGFLALNSPKAGEICRLLREAGVWTDHRQGALRLGPAPYLSPGQLKESLAILGEVVARLVAG